MRAVATSHSFTLLFHVQSDCKTVGFFNTNTEFGGCHCFGASLTAYVASGVYTCLHCRARTLRCRCMSLEAPAATGGCAWNVAS